MEELEGNRQGEMPEQGADRLRCMSRRILREVGLISVQIGQLQV